MLVEGDEREEGALPHVWLEVALNGPWGRARQPAIPIAPGELVEEGVACVRAGAAIVHVHAYDPASGRQNDDPDVYREVITGIQAEGDAIVYPTIPLVGGPELSAAAERFRAVEVLAGEGLLEWCTVDPGSVNLSLFADLRDGEDDFVYLNPSAHVRHGLALAARHAFRPAYACYEPGFVRLGAALAAQYPAAPAPVYRLMFSDQFAFGFPPQRYALDALVRQLRGLVPEADWMVAGLGVDIAPLIAPAVELGGHVRVGLEDAPLGTGATNVGLVRQAVDAIEAAGGTLASATDVRARRPASETPQE